MKISEITNISESVDSVLNAINASAEQHNVRQTNASYLATLMVIRDMDVRYSDEDHPLKSKTFIDYLYSDDTTTKKAINVFHKRIQENPRARILLKKYIEQFMDYSYGHQIMRNRIASLRDYFDKRKDQRIKHHEQSIVTNFNSAQEKFLADYTQDMTKND